MDSDSYGPSCPISGLIHVPLSGPCVDMSDGDNFRLRLNALGSETLLKISDVLPTFVSTNDCSLNYVLGDSIFGSLLAGFNCGLISVRASPSLDPSVQIYSETSTFTHLLKTLFKSQSNSCPPETSFVCGIALSIVSFSENMTFDLLESFENVDTTIANESFKSSLSKNCLTNEVEGCRVPVACMADVQELINASRVSSVLSGCNNSFASPIPRALLFSIHVTLYRSISTDHSADPEVSLMPHRTLRVDFLELPAVCPVGWNHTSLSAFWSTSPSITVIEKTLLSSVAVDTDQHQIKGSYSIPPLSTDDAVNVWPDNTLIVDVVKVTEDVRRKKSKQMASTHVNNANNMNSSGGGHNLNSENSSDNNNRTQQFLTESINGFDLSLTNLGPTIRRLLCGSYKTSLVTFLLSDCAPQITKFEEFETYISHLHSGSPTDNTKKDSKDVPDDPASVIERATLMGANSLIHEQFALRAAQLSNLAALRLASTIVSSCETHPIRLPAIVSAEVHCSTLLALQNLTRKYERAIELKNSLGSLLVDKKKFSDAAENHPEVSQASGNADLLAEILHAAHRKYLPLPLDVSDSVIDSRLDLCMHFGQTALDEPTELSNNPSHPRLRYLSHDSFENGALVISFTPIDPQRSLETPVVLAGSQFTPGSVHLTGAGVHEVAFATTRRENGDVIVWSPHIEGVTVNGFPLPAGDNIPPVRLRHGDIVIVGHAVHAFRFETPDGLKHENKSYAAASSYVDLALVDWHDGREWSNLQRHNKDWKGPLAPQLEMARQVLNNDDDAFGLLNAEFHLTTRLVFEANSRLLYNYHKFQNTTTTVVKDSSSSPPVQLTVALSLQLRDIEGRLTFVPRPHIEFAPSAEDSYGRVSLDLSTLLDLMPSITSHPCPQKLLLAPRGSCSSRVTCISAVRTYMDTLERQNQILNVLLPDMTVLVSPNAGGPSIPEIVGFMNEEKGSNGGSRMNEFLDDFAAAGRSSDREAAANLDVEEKAFVARLHDTLSLEEIKNASDLLREDYTAMFQSLDEEDEEEEEEEEEEEVVDPNDQTHGYKNTKEKKKSQSVVPSSVSSSKKVSSSPPSPNSNHTLNHQPMSQSSISSNSARNNNSARNSSNTSVNNSFVPKQGSALPSNSKTNRPPRYNSVGHAASDILVIPFARNNNNNNSNMRDHASPPRRLRRLQALQGAQASERLYSIAKLKQQHQNHHDNIISPMRNPPLSSKRGPSPMKRLPSPAPHSPNLLRNSSIPPAIRSSPAKQRQQHHSSRSQTPLKDRSASFVNADKNNKGMINKSVLTSKSALNPTSNSQESPKSNQSWAPIPVGCDIDQQHPLHVSMMPSATTTLDDFASFAPHVTSSHPTAVHNNNKNTATNKNMVGSGTILMPMNINNHGTFQPPFRLTPPTSIPLVQSNSMAGLASSGCQTSSSSSSASSSSMMMNMSSMNQSMTQSMAQLQHPYHLMKPGFNPHNNSHNNQNGMTDGFPMILQQSVSNSAVPKLMTSVSNQNLVYAHLPAMVDSSTSIGATTANSSKTSIPIPFQQTMPYPYPLHQQQQHHVMMPMFQQHQNQANNMRHHHRSEADYLNSTPHFTN